MSKREIKTFDEFIERARKHGCEKITLTPNSFSDQKPEMISRRIVAIMPTRTFEVTCCAYAHGEERIHFDRHVLTYTLNGANKQGQRKELRELRKISQMVLKGMRLSIKRKLPSATVITETQPRQQ